MKSENISLPANVLSLNETVQTNALLWTILGELSNISSKVLNVNPDTHWDEVLKTHSTHYNTSIQALFDPIPDQE